MSMFLSKMATWFWILGDWNPQRIWQIVLVVAAYQSTDGATSLFYEDGVQTVPTACGTTILGYLRNVS